MIQSRTVQIAREVAQRTSLVSAARHRDKSSGIVDNSGISPVFWFIYTTAVELQHKKLILENRWESSAVYVYLHFIPDHRGVVCSILVVAHRSGQFSFQVGLSFATQQVATYSDRQFKHKDNYQQ